MNIRLAGGAEPLHGGVDHRGVQVGAGGVPRAGRMDRTVGTDQHLHEGGSVIEVDDRWGSAPIGHHRGLGVIVDQSDDLVAVFLQVGQYVGSDETRGTG